MADRKPLMVMPDGEREAALAARGLGTDLIPLDASPAEWRAAMEDQKPAAVVAPAASPTGTPLVPARFVPYGMALFGILTALASLPTLGIGIIPLAVCNGMGVGAVILGILLGVASPGLRKAP